MSTYLRTIIMLPHSSTHLQCEFPLEDQINPVARGSQEEVFLHLETLPRGLRGCNDFVFTQDSADMQSQLQVGKVHASAANPISKVSQK